MIKVLVRHIEVQNGAATLNRATVKRRQFTGRHLTGATIKRSDR